MFFFISIHTYCYLIIHTTTKYIQHIPFDFYFITFFISSFILIYSVQYGATATSKLVYSCLKQDSPRLRLSLRRCCLLTKHAASVLKSMAAARKQIVATIPATTGLASPSSEISVGGKGSERGDTLQSVT